jgi:xanthine dehydrogenase accessory factor
MLRDTGIPTERIGELVCPIGVGGIKSKAPAVIATATAAELLMRDEALRVANTDANESRRQLCRRRPG